MIKLVLIPDSDHHDEGDLYKIAALISGRCSDVKPIVCHYKKLKWYQWSCLASPVLYVSWKRIKRFKPIRGELLHGQKLSKSEQYEILDRKGIPTLKWERITPETKLSIDDWGDYVVIKPDMGKAGHNVKVMRTKNVRCKNDTPFDAGAVVQELVYTGEEPISYRCLTLFGRALFLIKYVNTRCGNKFDSKKNFGEIGGGHNIVASARGSLITQIDEPEIIQFAESVASKAFSDIPLLGIDVARCRRTQKLYMLEANPFGQTWHFSSKIGLGMQTDNDLCFESQFGAFDIAANRLIEVARARAK
jgi:hypothetical protein